MGFPPDPPPPFRSKKSDRSRPVRNRGLLVVGMVLIAFGRCREAAYRR